MKPSSQELHLHIWPDLLNMSVEQQAEWDGDPDEDIDLTWSGSYPNMVPPEAMEKYGNDGYYQFSGDLSDGRTIELRIPLDIVLKLMDPEET